MSSSKPWLIHSVAGYAKAVTCLKPVICVLGFSLSLSACVGTETGSSSSGGVTVPPSSNPPSSSAVTPQSSVSVSSVASACSADIDNGQAIYLSGGLDCKTCHGEPDGGSSTPGGASIAISIFEPPYGIKDGETHPELNAYIATYMNQYFNSACAKSSAECGEDIAAYLYDTAGRDWCAEKMSSSPTVSSAPVISSTPAQSSSSSQSSVSEPEEPRFISVITLNVGGGDVLDSNGVKFSADGYFDGGNVSDLSAGLQEVPNTDDDDLFRTERWEAFKYSFELPNDTYKVELGFIELVEAHTAGSRVFNVAMEGQVRLSNLDITQEAGGSRAALVKEVENIVVNDGKLDLDFRKVTHNPTVSYIHIKRLEGPKDKYERMCGYCHGGESGEFRSQLGDALVKSRCEPGVCSSRESLAGYITATMPFGLPESCTGQCAEEISNYIFDNFAGFGNNPPVNLPDYLDTAGDIGSCGRPNSGFVGVRRVAQLDYNNMVNDLFKLDESFVDGFSGDEELGSFLINFKRTPSIAQVLAYFSAAKNVAEKAVAVKASWASCTAQNNNCAKEIITDIGRKAYRKNLTNQQVNRLMSIFESARDADNFNQGLKVTIQAILTSPRFLYYVESGQGSGEIVSLTQYELAARMAYFLWRSLPDNELLDAVANNQLQTAAQIRAQAERMLNDQRARDIVSLFHTQWMQLKAPDLGGQDYNAQQAELEGFARTVASIILGDDLNGDGKSDNAGANAFGSLNDLFSTNYGYLNADSKSLYDVSGGPIAQGHDGFNKYQLNGNRRSGILSRVAFLRSSGDALHRGLFMRQELLCQVIPDPPPNAASQPLPSVEGLNPRELFALHTQDPGCAGCHILMDPLGYPLDHFDDKGQWRNQYDGGFPVDASGELVLTDVARLGALDGGQELQQRLGESKDVQACYTFKWFQFATGRLPSDDDACSLGQINEGAYSNQGSGSIKDVMINIILSDSFRNFRAAP